MRSLMLGALVAGVLFTSVSTAKSNPLTKCGNINQSLDGKITLSDITRLVDRVYISKQPLENEAVGNINGSLDRLITLSDITMLISHVYLSAPAPTCLHSEEIRGDCLGYDLMSAATTVEYGYMYLEVVGSSLHIYHIDAWYQCCLIYGVDYQVEGNTITATEVDLMAPEGCKCMCWFDVRSELSLLQDGEYEVILINEDGDTVGVDTAVIGGAAIVDYSRSDCKSGVMPPLSLSENLTYTYSDGTVTMNHVDAMFNCAFELAVNVELAGDTLRFYEINVEEAQVDCICPFDITATASGIDPGTYVVEVYQSWMGEPPVMVDQRTVVF